MAKYSRSYSDSRSETGETVREAISRRALEGIAELVQKVESQGIPLQVGFQCITILHSVVYPFVTSDTKPLLDQVVADWKALADQATQAALEQTRFRQNLAQTSGDAGEMAF